jgi:hypothetical protein
MFRSVVWQLVHGQSGGMPWIRIEEEIREIFNRHRVAFDERYVWD